MMMGTTRRSHRWKERTRGFWKEWKANLDLLKFYETLKQQRFAHFLTIQTAFLAIFGLLAKEAIGVFSVVSIATLAVIPIPPLFIAYYFMRLDARGRAFVDTANTRLLLIEDEWKALFPANHFSTYQQQFAVLSRRDEKVVDKYLAIRNVTAETLRSVGQGAFRARALGGRDSSAVLVVVDHCVQLLVPAFAYGILRIPIGGRSDGGRTIGNQNSDGVGSASSGCSDVVDRDQRADAHAEQPDAPLERHALQAFAGGAADRLRVLRRRVASSGRA